MQNLKDYIENVVRIDEMATIGLFPDGEDTYKLSVHGDITYDRQTSPHLHVYPKKGNDFDLEFSLEDLLTKDKWVRLRVRDFRDKHHRIDNTEKTEDWAPYNKVLKMIQTFIFEENYVVDGITYKDPLHYAIVSWNKEYDFSAYRRGENSLLKLLNEKGLKILPKYESYFN